MELLLSICALIVSVLSFVFSLVVYEKGLRRERKQATLDAFNNLQAQALDKLNTYSHNEITEIAEHPRSLEYKEITVLLARCQHFAVGVNSDIYDKELLKRLAGLYFIALYDKLEPIIEKKRALNKKEKHYAEFEQLIMEIKKAKK